MKPRARVTAAICRQPVDQLPCAEIVINEDLMAMFFDTEQVEFSQKLEFIQRMGLDGVCLSPNFHSFTKYLPLPGEVECKHLHRWVKNDYFVFAVLDGPIGWGIRLLGFDDLMRKLAHKHLELQEFVAKVEKLNVAFIEQAAAAGVDGIIIADDIAFNQGPIARPELLRQLIFTSLSRQVAFAKAKKIPVFFHSDGNLTKMLPDIVAAGFDGLQCLERLAGMDLGAVKKQYGDKLCLWGNLDPAVVLEKHSQNELAGFVGEVLLAAEQGESGRGFIFGTSSGLFAPMQPVILQTIYRLVKNKD